MTTVAAVDVGAESGRVLSVELAGDGLRLGEWHRFSTPVHSDEAGTLRWGLGELQRHIADGLTRLGEHGAVDAAGVDTWGIDFGLLDEDGRLLGNPVSHRDRRTAGMLAEADRRVGRLRLYQETGIQLLEINSVYQLLAMQLAGDPALERARLLLMMPDLVHRAMSGAAVCEYTNATTTGFYDVRRGTWAVELLDGLGIPHHFLGDVVAPGTVDGELLPSFAAAPGLHQLRHVVTGRGRADRAGGDRGLARRPADQRGRIRRPDPLAAQRDGPVDAPGVPPAVVARGR
jgi:rhamnulokinase